MVAVCLFQAATIYGYITLMMYKKSFDLFPIKRDYAFFAHCAVSPLFRNALDREMEVAERHHRQGAVFAVDHYLEILDSLSATFLFERTITSW